MLARGQLRKRAGTIVVEVRDESRSDRGAEHSLARRNGADRALDVLLVSPLQQVALGACAHSCEHRAPFGPMIVAVIRSVADDVENAIIPDCGHWITEEQPQATTDLVVDFLSRPR